MELNLKIKELNLKGYCVEEELNKLEEEYLEFKIAANYYNFLRDKKEFNDISTELLKKNCLEEAADLIQVTISVLQKLNLTELLEDYIKNEHAEKMKRRPR